jgi:diguanylate cyclase (GGDEF)-like protein
MSQLGDINELLDGMYAIRPVVIAAMPDDQKQRSITRSMIATLEKMQRTPAIPMETHDWICHLMSGLVDAEHGALLRPNREGEIPASAKQSLEHHIEQRRQLLLEAQDISPTHGLLDQNCDLLASKVRETESLQGKARHLKRLLQDHLQNDSALHDELQQLIEAINPAFSAISDVLDHAGEDPPELKQVKLLLEQELPDDPKQARKLLQKARRGILQAGDKLTEAGVRLRKTMEDHAEQLSGLARKLEQAKTEARNDPLTGLANRRRLAEFLHSLERTGFGFLIIDIDFFKKINDDYGHDTGDEILAGLAACLNDCIRSSDLAARIGGEEFCIVFPGTDLDTSASLAESLRQSVQLHPFKTQQGSIDVTVSIGVTLHIAGADQSETFKAADQALYQAKNSGRNQVCISMPPGKANAS